MPPLAGGGSSPPPATGTLVGAGAWVGASVFGAASVGITVAGIAVGGAAIGVDGSVVGPGVPCDTSVDSAVGVTVNSGVAVMVPAAVVADAVPAAVVADAVVTGTTVRAADVAVALSARSVGVGSLAVAVALGVIAVGVVESAVLVGSLVFVGVAWVVLVGAAVSVAAGVLVGGAVVAVIAAIVAEGWFAGPLIVSVDVPRALVAPAVTSTVLRTCVPFSALELARVRTSTEASVADDVTNEHESWFAVSVQVPPLRSVIVSA